MIGLLVFTCTTISVVQYLSWPTESSDLLHTLSIKPFYFQGSGTGIMFLSADTNASSLHFWGVKVFLNHMSHSHTHSYTESKSYFIQCQPSYQMETKIRTHSQSHQGKFRIKYLTQGHINTSIGGNRWFSNWQTTTLLPDATVSSFVIIHWNTILVILKCAHFTT